MNWRGISGADGQRPEWPDAGKPIGAIVVGENNFRRQMAAAAAGHLAATSPITNRPLDGARRSFSGQRACLGELMAALFISPRLRPPTAEQAAPRPRSQSRFSVTRPRRRTPTRANFNRVCVGLLLARGKWAIWMIRRWLARSQNCPCAP